MACYDICRPCGPTPLANSCNEPCALQCQDSRVVIQPSPVLVTLPGPIMTSFPQNTAVGSTSSAAVGTELSVQGQPISGGFGGFGYGLGYGRGFGYGLGGLGCYGRRGPSTPHPWPAPTSAVPADPPRWPTAATSPVPSSARILRVVINPSPVLMTLPGPIMTSFPQNTAVGSTSSAAVGTELSVQGQPISGGFGYGLGYGRGFGYGLGGLGCYGRRGGYNC
ncbi:hypothetical protein DUI87_06806 [Hirundo rustica rustica]|uniref:Keratin n=5 Tax=Passeriformes TaxID=9126 RepID=A0A3M0KTC4_HIRRU|nr:hypothetical protein DUI87_06806 [Hirundo rustica rustica]